MASSSVSQESLDLDDMDMMARRNRVKVHRGHSGRGSMPHRSIPDKLIHSDKTDYQDTKEHPNGNVGDIDSDAGLGLSSHAHLPGDHESPTRGVAARLKDKRGRPNHVKGKLPKDKRKIREKRRSTGVVHCIPSTESTGDSLEDDDDDEDNGHDTKRNTLYNEGTTPGHHHQGAHETKHSSAPVYSHRNKSPSDLDADLEDNQDYDSTVSHSETNLSLIGRSESLEISQNAPVGQQIPDSRLSVSRHLPEATLAYKLNTSSNAATTRITSRTISSVPSSLLSRVPEPAAGTLTSGSGSTQESDSSNKFNTSTTEPNLNPPQIHARPAGFSVFNNSSLAGQRGDRSSHSSYMSSASRFRERDGGPSSIHSRLATYSTPRPFGVAAPPSVSNLQHGETISLLEKQLEKEKQETSKLQQTLKEKDQKIVELLKEIELLNKECDDLDTDNIQLQEENKALIRAMSKLTSNV